MSTYNLHIIANNDYNGSYKHAKPIQGSNYYRLRLENNDGKKYFSQVRELNFDNSFVMHIYPNPVKSKLKVIISGDDMNEPITLSLFTAMGQKVLDKVFVSTTDLNMESVDPGLYMLQTKSRKGIQVVKILKQ